MVICLAEDRISNSLNALGERYRSLAVDPGPEAMGACKRILREEFPEAVEPLVTRIARSAAYLEGGAYARRELSEDLEQEAWSHVTRPDIAHQAMMVDRTEAYCVRVIQNKLSDSLRKERKHFGTEQPWDEESEGPMPGVAKDPLETLLANDLESIAPRLANLQAEWLSENALCVHHQPGEQATEHQVVLAVLEGCCRADNTVMRRALLAHIRERAGLGAGDIRLARDYSICLDWFLFRLTDGVPDTDPQRCKAGRAVIAAFDATTEGRFNGKDRCDLDAARRMRRDPLLCQLIAERLAGQVASGMLTEEARADFIALLKGQDR